MTPRAIVIENFGPFKARQEFRFPDGPGLYFMWGDNRAEPRLEGNGAGKTSLWNALTWVLHGKTARGLRAGDAANWDVAKGSRVQLEFSDPGLTGKLPAFVERTWGPNTWTYKDLFGKVVDLAADETNPVADALRLSFSAFLNSVLLAQGQPMFLDMRPDAKAALFSDVMGLDKWVERSKRAADIAKGWDDELRRAEAALAHVEGRLHGLGADDADDLSRKHDAWEVEQMRRRLSLRGRYEEALDRERDAKAALAAAEGEVARARGEVESREPAIRAHKAVVDDYDRELAQARKKRDEAKGALDGMERDIEFLRKHARCPTCGQDTPALDHGHLVERDMAMDEFAALDMHVEQVAAEAELAQARLAKARREVIGLDDELRDRESALRDARRALDMLARDLDDMEAEDDQLADEANPYADMLRRRRQERGQLQRERDDARRAVEHADSRRELFGYWARWHKEIRLQMIADALVQLEIEVNAEASALGLVGWELRFDVDRETKGGNVQRGFSTTVLSPHNDRPVPWEAWSGGESQRLRAAAQMGLSNLIRRRTGATIPLEVWDEPTQWLSAQGVEDLLVALAERAHREGLQVWVVDHRSLGHGGFAGSFGVVKEAGMGSRFVEGSYSSRHGDDQRAGGGEVAHRARRRADPEQGGTLERLEGLAFGASRRTRKVVA